MPSRFVVQPNGLLARFSTVVDDFTEMNMTESEAAEVVAQEYAERAKHDAEQAIARAKAASGTFRWQESLETIRAVHGDHAVDERMRFLEPEQRP
jgi:hypothetical protein